MRGKFYRVDVQMVEDYGFEAAFLYAVIENISQVRPKDEQGYFTIKTKTLKEKLGVGHSRLGRIRSILEGAGLISFRPGRNQNSRCLYRINRHY